MSLAVQVYGNHRRCTQHLADDDGVGGIEQHHRDLRDEDPHAPAESLPERGGGERRQACRQRLGKPRVEPQPSDSTQRELRDCPAHGQSHKPRPGHHEHHRRRGASDDRHCVQRTEKRVIL